MKRFLLMLCLCATAQAGTFLESYAEDEMVKKGMIVELDQLHQLQEQKRELQRQVEELRNQRNAELKEALSK